MLIEQLKAINPNGIFDMDLRLRLRDDLAEQHRHLIKDDISLDSISDKLKGGLYSTVDAIAMDVDHMVQNMIRWCEHRQANGDDTSQLIKQSLELKSFFLDQLAMRSELVDEFQGVYPLPVQRMTYSDWIR